MALSVHPGVLAVSYSLLLHSSAYPVPRVAVDASHMHTILQWTQFIVNTDVEESGRISTRDWFRTKVKTRTDICIAWHLRRLQLAMSLRPGLLASTSRLGVGLRTAYPAALQSRAYATPSKAGSGVGTAEQAGLGVQGSVQGHDAELAKRREGQNMRRMPAGLDVSKTYENVVMGECYLTLLTRDHTVEPKFQLSWLSHPRFWHPYIKEMGYKRYATTFQRCARYNVADVQREANEKVQCFPR